MRSRKVWVGIILVVGLAAWAAFRPERLWIDQTVNESFETSVQGTSTAAGEPQVLASGQFHKGAHETMGAASIYRLANGKRVLRLTNFETSNGPEVHVYLVKAQDALDNDTVKNAGFVDLGDLKGNVGDQNYDVPDDVDLTAYRAVTIWCRRFGVNFGTAPLQAAAMRPSGPVLLTSGSFHSVAHDTRGSAEIYQLADGRRVLRLTHFETSNGPELHVYLVAAADAADNDTVKNAGFINVADLKGNVGDQNYDLPDGVDLDKYRAVTIWCRRFGVNFGTAPLRPLQS